MNKLEELKNEIDNFARQLRKLRSRTTIALDDLCLLLHKIDILQANAEVSCHVDVLPDDLSDILIETEADRLAKDFDIVKEDIKSFLIVFENLSGIKK